MAKRRGTDSIPSGRIECSYGLSFVPGIYKEFIIEDLKNKVFMYSPVFYNNGTTFDLTYYETFRTNFYFKTESYQNSDEFIADMSIRAIRFFHPLLIHNFTNPCLQIDKNENIINCNLNTQSETKTITIQNNNVESLVLGGVYNYSVKNYRQSLSIETENYVEIVLSDPISYDDLLSYVNEFDVFISIYSPTKLRTYATQFRADSGKLLTVVHKLLILLKMIITISYLLPLKIRFLLLFLVWCCPILFL